MGLGAIFGYSGIDVSATTQAQVRQEPVPGCGLCVLGHLDTRGPVTVQGGDSFAAATGRVRTNGSNNGFVEVRDGGVLTFASPPNPPTGPYSPDPRISAAPSDPFSAVPTPLGSPNPGTVTCGIGGGAQPSLTQGVYDRIEVTGPCSASGLITVTDRLRVRSGGQLSGLSATIYLTCGDSTAPTSCSGNGGRFQVQSGGTVDVSGGTLSGYSIVADTGNTRRLDVDGNVTLSESLYIRTAQLRLRNSASLVAGARVVVSSLNLGQGSAVLVTSSGAGTVPGPIDVRLLK